MTGKRAKPVNVEKGKQGFQETTKDAPSSGLGLTASDVGGAHAGVVGVPSALDSSMRTYRDALIRQVRGGSINDETIEAHRVTNNCIDAILRRDYEPEEFHELTHRLAYYTDAIEDGPYASTLRANTRELERRMAASGYVKNDHAYDEFDGYRLSVEHTGNPKKFVGALSRHGKHLGMISLDENEARHPTHPYRINLPNPDVEFEFINRARLLSPKVESGWQTSVIERLRASEDKGRPVWQVTINENERKAQA